MNRGTSKELNANPTHTLNMYVLFQFVAGLSATALFLIKQSLVSLPGRAGISAAIVMTVVHGSILIEDKVRKWFSGRFRVVTLPPFHAPRT